MKWKKLLKKAGLTKKKFGGPLKALAATAAIGLTGGLAAAALPGIAGLGSLSGLAAAGIKSAEGAIQKAGTHALMQSATADGGKAVPSKLPVGQTNPEVKDFGGVIPSDKFVQVQYV